MFGRMFFVLIMSLLLASCGTVTMKSKGINKLSDEPTYSETKTFYLGGLVGEHTVDVRQLCNGKVPTQIQSQFTFMNSLLTGLTLTIYAPRTIHVWCPKGGV